MTGAGKLLVVIAAASAMQGCGKDSEPVAAKRAASAAASAADSWVSRTPLEFKGFAFGTPFAEVNTASSPTRPSLGLTGCALRGQFSILICDIKGGTFANQPTRSLMVEFLDERLSSVRILMHSDGFDAASAALEEKYGKPFRADASKSDLTWLTPGDGAIFATRRISDGEMSAISLHSGADMKASRARDEAAKLKAKKDI